MDGTKLVAKEPIPTAAVEVLFCPFRCVLEPAFRTSSLLLKKKKDNMANLDTKPITIFCAKIFFLPGLSGLFTHRVQNLSLSSAIFAASEKKMQRMTGNKNKQEVH